MFFRDFRFGVPSRRRLRCAVYLFAGTFFGLAMAAAATIVGIDVWAAAEWFLLTMDTKWMK